MRDDELTTVDWEVGDWGFEAIDPDLIKTEFMSSQKDYFKLVRGSGKGEFVVNMAASQMAPCWRACVLKVAGNGEPESPAQKLPAFDGTETTRKKYFEAAGDVRADEAKEHLEGALTVAGVTRKIVLFQVADARVDKNTFLVLGVKPPAGVGPDGGGVGNGGSH